MLDDAWRYRVLEKLTRLYGAAAPGIGARIEAMVGRFRAAHPDLAQGQRRLPHDAMLITYGDQITASGEAPLDTLHAWCAEHLAGAIDAVHILPFFPYTSDDGFSVVDYKAIDPALGDWPAVNRMAGRFALMFDAVINHASASSAWFQAFLEDRAPERDYFTAVAPDTDLHAVVRPRTTPLLHRFDTAAGPKHVWTTFSADQIDLNYASPDLLLAVLDVLLFYAANGARLIRLDAIAFIWKRLGTGCMSLPETHALVKLMRDVLDAAAPATLVVTETNVPHAENVSYFGDGGDEAQMVYNFALPPLLIDAVWRRDARRLSAWAADLEHFAGAAGFFNMTATHDGIGVRGASAYVTAAEIDALAQGIEARGGLVSRRTLPDGGTAPYELNCTFFDALLPPSADPDALDSLDRYITAQAVALSLDGVPGIYVHNLFGTRNHYAGLEGKDATQTEFKRLVNRRRFTRAELDDLLADPHAREARIFRHYLDLLRIWRQEPAFAPGSGQRVLDLPPGLFALYRGEGSGRPVLAIHNLSGATVPVDGVDVAGWRDLITGATVAGDRLTVAPWQMLWLKAA